MHNNTSVIIFMHFSFRDCDEEEVRGFDTRNQGQHKAGPPSLGLRRLFIFRHCFRVSIVSSARKDTVSAVVSA